MKLFREIGGRLLEGSRNGGVIGKAASGIAVRTRTTMQAKAKSKS